MIAIVTLLQIFSKIVGDPWWELIKVKPPLIKLGSLEKKIILLNLLLVVIFIVKCKGLFCRVRGIVFLPLQLYIYDGLASHPGGGRGGGGWQYS